MNTPTQTAEQNLVVAPGLAIPTEPEAGRDGAVSFWRKYRQGLLMLVDTIERDILKMEVTTADIRKMWKKTQGPGCE